MPELIKCIDVSNYSGFIELWQAQVLVNAGFKRAIVGTQRSVYTRQQMAMLAYVGIELQAYVYLNMPGGQFWTGKSAWDQVSEAIDMCWGYPVKYIWLDCEDSRNTMSQADTVSFIQEAADACIGRMRSGIYTVGGWWIPNTGNSYRFSSWPLWVATGDRVPDLQGWAPFGGWYSAYMEQYVLDTFLNGVINNVDLNVGFSEDSPIQESSEDDVETKELDQAQTVAALEAVAKTFGNDLNDLGSYKAFEILRGAPGVADGMVSIAFVMSPDDLAKAFQNAGLSV